jgi:hypothetical protein
MDMAMVLAATRIMVKVTTEQILVIRNWTLPMSERKPKIAQELWLQACARRGSPIPKPKRRASRQLGLATVGLMCKADPEKQNSTDRA